MASVGAPDAKGLEGRQEGESTAPRSREFFWDSLVLYVVLAISALTAIDAVVEFIRGSDVQCFLPNNSSALDEVKDYVIKICAGSLPRTEYLPVYIAIHAILILAPHYLWLNTFDAKLDFFFQHVSELVRTRDEKTGEYAKKNYVISQQLEEAFSRSNWMYRLYLLKLFFQFIVSVVGFGLVLRYLNDYREVYTCPANDDDLDSKYWPLQNQTVNCVFTSLRLLGQINVAYLVLLALAVICLFGSMIWLVSAHPSKLGIRNVAKFSFQSGLPTQYFSPEPPTPHPSSGLGAIAHGLLSSLRWFSLQSPYNILSDYDFLVIKLFRTDGGLAYVLRGVHALRLLKEENDIEYARVNIYKRQLAHDGKRDIAKASFLQADLGWKLPKKAECHQQVHRNTPLVGVINFSPYFMDYINTAINCSDSSTKPHIVTVTCPEDILATGKTPQTTESSTEEGDDDAKKTAMKIWDPQDKFLKDIDEIWKPGIISARIKDLIGLEEWSEMDPDSRPARFEYSELAIEAVETDYIVIGPLTSDLQVATVNLLLEQKSDYISDDAVLLAIRPLRIAGRDLESEFLDYKPPSFFPKRVPQKARQLTPSEDEPTWPNSPIGNSLDPHKFFKWEMKAGATDCKLCFTLYQRGSEEEISNGEDPPAPHGCSSCWRRGEEGTILLQTP